MSTIFEPDYRHILQAARNQAPARLPLYEHIISEIVMEEILSNPFADLAQGGTAEKREYIRQYTRFFREMGYDTVSFERLVSAVLPGSGALYGHQPGCINNREDFAAYPWDSLPDTFFNTYQEDYQLLAEEMPAGMKAIGGPGNGLFECVQDLVGYEQLCYIAVDDPQLYSDLFSRVGETLYSIWVRFLDRFGDTFVVCRMGDDLGFRTATLLAPADIRRLIIPQYQKIVALCHARSKPFLLHSCGCIFEIMDDLIETVGIDAKHSNEDAIAPFSHWLHKYGERIGNFGGIDTDILCQKQEEGIREYVGDIASAAANFGGVALGSGNSIPEYVPAEGYLAMVEAVRAFRGE